MNLKVAILLFVLMFFLTSEGTHEFEKKQDTSIVNRTDIKMDYSQIMLNKALNESSKSFEQRIALRDTTLHYIKTKKQK